jgi:hypothetical protein
MYFYPDNIQESILLFQNGKFDYSHLKDAPRKILESSKIDTVALNKERWNLTVWNITNVLPIPGRVEEGIAAFPEEIPRRLIKLFTMVGETVFDPFAGSGTTLRVARELGRKGIGYEIDLELKPVIRKKLEGQNFVIEEREGAKRLRKSLQTKIHQQRSVAKLLWPEAKTKPPLSCVWLVAESSLKDAAYVLKKCRVVKRVPTLWSRVRRNQLSLISVYVGVGDHDHSKSVQSSPAFLRERKTPKHVNSLVNKAFNIPVSCNLGSQRRLELLCHVKND